MGEDPDREGLVETPRRVADMYAEVFSGLEEDPHKHLKIFTESHHDEMVTVQGHPAVFDVRASSDAVHRRCAYRVYPEGRKGDRAVETRADCQLLCAPPAAAERLTAQVADFLQKELEPQGVAVIIEAEHLCMTMRGAKAAGARTQTSALRGLMKSDVRTRAGSGCRC